MVKNGEFPSKEHLFIYSLIILLVFCAYFWGTDQNNQVGGSREGIFSRFKYEPQYPFMSKFTEDDPVKFSKRYNRAGPLRLIMSRPYRFYTMPLGNWGYPWHFPERTDPYCLVLSSDRCDEPIDWEKELIRPSKCFDSVYKQCRSGIDPLLIKIN